MPQELDALFRRLDDVLIIEQILRFADRRFADFGHQIAEVRWRSDIPLRKCVILLYNIVNLFGLDFRRAQV